MYLTRIVLDNNKTKTKTAYTQRNLFHGAIEMAFSTVGGKKLWRIDTVKNKDYLMLLSENMPDTRPLIEQFGTGADAETLDYNIVLDKLTEGSYWNFRCVANACRRKPSELGRLGKPIAHTIPKYQKQWLMAHAEKNGFKLLPDQFVIKDTNWEKFTRKTETTKDTITFLSVTYEGILCVTNAELFREAIKKGFGREKAYGMGMMTLIPA